jgi:hypothetical protein
MHCGAAVTTTALQDLAACSEIFEAARSSSMSGAFTTPATVNSPAPQVGRPDRCRCYKMADRAQNRGMH